MSRTKPTPSLAEFAASQMQTTDRTYIGTQVPQDVRDQIPLDLDPPHTVVAEWLRGLGYDASDSKVATWRKQERQRRKEGTTPA